MPTRIIFCVMYFFTIVFLLVNRSGPPGSRPLSGDNMPGSDRWNESNISNFLNHSAVPSHLRFILTIDFLIFPLHASCIPTYRIINGMLTIYPSLPIRELRVLPPIQPSSVAVSLTVAAVCLPPCCEGIAGVDSLDGMSEL